MIGWIANYVNRKFDLCVKLNPPESLTSWRRRRWVGLFLRALIGVLILLCLESWSLHTALCCVASHCDSKQFKCKYGSYHAVSVFLLSLCFCEDLAAPSGNHQEILLWAQSSASVGHYRQRPCVHVSVCTIFSWLPALAGLKVKYQPFFPQHRP